MLMTARHGRPLETRNQKTRSATGSGPFGYFFPDADSWSEGETGKLDTLASAMVDQATAAQNNSRIAPVFTYLGQFIDHDITANTDRDTDFSDVRPEVIEPAQRSEVVSQVMNLRAGSLRLDSLYGALPGMDSNEARFAAMLRHPVHKAKMWIGTLQETAFGRVPLPDDPAADLLRLDRVIAAPHQQITEAEIRALPAPLRDSFVNEDGTLRVQRAIIGDGRNDENLAVAQLHLAFLRFHNVIVDALGASGTVEHTFAAAQQQVQWIYQWLIINEYLPTICGQDVTDDVLADGAPLYAHFAGRMGAIGDFAPMPLEFSVSAFRFGHTMVREAYDWSEKFGRGPGALKPRASFKDLFDFTGGAINPMPEPGGGNAARLPSQWGIDWSRFVDVAPHPDRSARLLDAQISPQLFDMENEDPNGLHAVLRSLSRRNLRRGYRLDIPSGQSCVAGVQALIGKSLPAMTSAQLLEGATGQAVKAGNYHERTPLWFYVLKEAEQLCGGERLGPLGARLVAETLAGLVLNDTTSYWHQTGSDGGRWHPRDGVRPKGQAVTSIAELFRAAGVL